VPVLSSALVHHLSGASAPTHNDIIILASLGNTKTRDQLPLLDWVVPPSARRDPLLTDALPQRRRATVSRFR
jgi:hypothetical protein